MREEERLIYLGWPVDEAISLCHTLRREGVLRQFMEETERKYRAVCREIVDEAMGAR